ncbi:protease complex subunit PrcB family protein [Oceanirhabdus sp. W0125-5]|uniref:protease complex subunit PrcB family protein n=1 Tax=Oceanirhabdus sp. W0125-5 TaxID=2999116 RepID=UPI0022F2BAA5|nr:protease complex subunit PrcB family protein [Oceanirhabdus sp. W0125-5]WBW96976.1 protease complex subunit PrcB family protein [Oceanirhabdus sp. W0125-5]
MNRKRILSLVMAATLLVSGASTAFAQENGKKENVKVMHTQNLKINLLGKENSEKKVDFEVVDQKDIKDEKMNKWIASNIDKEGVSLYTEDKDYNYVMVANGMASGSGHEMVVTDMYTKGNTLYVEYHHNQPHGDVMTMNIAYPFTIVKISKDMKINHVKGENQSVDLTIIKNENIKDEGIKAWISKNIQEKGVYLYQEDKEYDYVMIANGRSGGSQHSMIFNGIHADGDTLYVNYNHFQTERGKLTRNLDYPFAIARISKDSKIKQVKVDQKEEQKKLVEIEGTIIKVDNSEKNPELAGESRFFTIKTKEGKSIDVFCSILDAKIKGYENIKVGNIIDFKGEKSQYGDYYVVVEGTVKKVQDSDKKIDKTTTLGEIEEMIKSAKSADERLKVIKVVIEFLNGLFR